MAEASGSDEDIIFAVVGTGAALQSQIVDNRPENESRGGEEEEEEEEEGVDVEGRGTTCTEAAPECAN